MLCLGIESTAHTFGVGIFNGKKIISDVRETYKPPLGEGIHPKKTSEFHEKNFTNIIKKALGKRKITDIDKIVVSQGPGLPPCLQVGMLAAKSLSKKYNIPLYGVNHCIAHIEMSRFETKAKDPIIVYVSGGNTQIIGYNHSLKKYVVYGETEDIPIGKAFDYLARQLNLGNPGGPIIDKRAKKGKYIDLSYTVKGMDLSFSGITTKAVNEFKKGNKIDDICFSFQQTCFSMLVEVAERAMAHTGKDEVLVTGGVGASMELKKMFRSMAKQRNAKFYSVSKKYAGDNGAMISIAGYHSKNNLNLKSDIKQKWRTDEVKTNLIEW